MINNINQISKELYEFDASNLGGGMFYDNFVVFNHGNNLYSVRNTNTGVISLTKADCAMNAIEKINGDTEESTDERSVYSEFELWAYERYKLEWCVQHNVLPKDVDEQVGINGCCFVCKDEFLNNELKEAHIFNYYFKSFLLIQLLAWIRDAFEEAEDIFEDDIKMSPAEITTYTGITNATDGKQKLIDYKMVLCRHSQLAENKVDKLIENSMDFLCSSVNKDKFVEEFVYRLSFRGYDNGIQF